jgi:DNA-binding response OmpR family regulator
MRILLIEDDKEMALTIKQELEKHFLVELAFRGKVGEDLALTNPYDLIILDNVLPDATGVEICKRLRAEQITTPILMLTGKAGVTDKVDALDNGVDDYVTKPFHFDELSARIRALLRRPPQNLESNIIIIGDLIIDLNKKLVTRGDKEISLRRKELYLLEYLARNVGRVITRDMILDHVWKSYDEPITNTIDVHIKYLRDRIDKEFDKKLIKTVHGIGYKLEA